MNELYLPLLRAVTSDVAPERAAHLEVVRAKDGSFVGRRIPLTSSRILVGRNSCAHFALPTGGNIGRQQIEFRFERGGWKVASCGATNGNFLNGKQIVDGGDGWDLQDGDRIDLVLLPDERDPGGADGATLVFRVARPSPA